MGWASKYIQKLSKGETVRFRPVGNSMRGLIESGQLCTIEPLSADRPLKVDDIVLTRIGSYQYLHLIKDISGGRFQIGNNIGGTNGWVPLRDIYGRCTKIED